MSKIKTLLENEGCSSTEQFIEEFAFESLVPGICMNKGCNSIYYYEPDQARGHCEECGTKTVKSGIMLLGIY